MGNTVLRPNPPLKAKDWQKEAEQAISTMNLRQLIRAMLRVRVGQRMPSQP